MLSGSVYNGFDIQGHSFVEERNYSERKNKPCNNCPGYYHFEALQPKGKEPGVLCVVLDTTTKNFRFAQGTVYRHNETDGQPDKSLKMEQISWLKEILNEYSQDGNWMVMVFGHHPLGKGFLDKSYKELITLFHKPEYNVIAYFCGHTHKHKIKYYRNKKHPESFGFWEIIADSIFEYPKRGSLVTVGYSNENRWELKVQSFWPYFLDKHYHNHEFPVMLENAKKSYDASKQDNKGKKLKRFNDPDLIKHRDVKLDFVFPK